MADSVTTAGPGRFEVGTTADSHSRCADLLGSCARRMWSSGAHLLELAIPMDGTLFVGRILREQSPEWPKSRRTRQFLRWECSSF
jgi:hypothetical protein